MTVTVLVWPPIKSLSVCVHVPALGEAATVSVNEVPEAGEAVAMLLHPAANDCVMLRLYGAFVQPVSDAVNVPVDPVPEVAYKSISGKLATSGPL